MLHITCENIEISRLLNGEPIILSHVTEGQFLSEMAAIENTPHSATARAACDGEAQVVDVGPFLERVSHDPARAHELILRLSIRLRETEEKIVGEQSSETKRRLTDNAEVEPVPPRA